MKDKYYQKLTKMIFKYNKKIGLDSELASYIDGLKDAREVYRLIMKEKGSK